MCLVYCVISMLWTWKIDPLCLEWSDGFQLIQNSSHMQYHENVKLSTRNREEYTGHEKLIGCYSGGEPEIEEILDGSLTSLRTDQPTTLVFFWFLVEFHRDRGIE